jgi:hypothetical protein
LINGLLLSSAKFVEDSAAKLSVVNIVKSKFLDILKPCSDDISQSERLHTNNTEQIELQMQA